MKTKTSASLRQKLLLLPLLFLLGLIAQQLSNLCTGRQFSEKVIFPGFAEQTLAGHANLLKAAVDIEAGTLAARLQSRESREEQTAAIVAKTDPIRFFDNRSGYFFTYDLQGVRNSVPTNQSENGRNF